MDIPSSRQDPRELLEGTIEELLQFVDHQFAASNLPPETLNEYKRLTARLAKVKSELASAQRYQDLQQAYEQANIFSRVFYSLLMFFERIILPNVDRKVRDDYLSRRSQLEDRSIAVSAAAASLLPADSATPPPPLPPPPPSSSKRAIAKVSGGEATQSKPIVPDASRMAFLDQIRGQHQLKKASDRVPPEPLSAERKKEVSEGGQIDLISALTTALAARRKVVKPAKTEDESAGEGWDGDELLSAPARVVVEPDRKAQPAGGIVPGRKLPETPLRVVRGVERASGAKKLATPESSSEQKRENPSAIKGAARGMIAMFEASNKLAEERKIADARKKKRP